MEETGATARISAGAALGIVMVASAATVTLAMCVGVVVLIIKVF